MNKNEKTQLERMIKENNVVDNTQLLRMMKSSQKLKESLTEMIENPNDENSGNYLKHNYDFLYKQVKDKKVHLDILYKMIESLENIENGKYNQHEASFEVGKLLKKLYIDHKLKEEKVMSDGENERKVNSGKSLSYNDYLKILKK